MIKKYLKNRIVIITLLLIVFCIFNLFLSYSYYIATVLNNESETTISLKSNGVIITYENNSGYIELDKMAPGSSVTKSFSISSNDTSFNTQDDISKIWYNIRLVVEENTFSDNAIVCSLAVDSSSTQLGQTATEFTNKGIVSGQNVDGMTLGTGYIVYGENNHTYNLTMLYPVQELYEVNKTMKAYVIVEVVDTVNLNIDLDGGIFPSGSSISRVYGKNAIVVLEDPTKERYEHIGWEVTVGDASVNANEITLGEGNVSIKALWKNAIPPASSFATDDWETIAYYAQHPVNDKTPYEVGETREISLLNFYNNESGSNGKYTIRIANNSEFDCYLDEYGVELESKTACGFVVEFQDIITEHSMNATSTNKGGWPATEMRDYLNNINNNQSIINSLSSDLKAVIIDTEVVSSHGSNSGETNFTSTDKLYLLSTREVWGNCSGGTNDEVGCWDFASLATITRQLDYYANLGIVTSDSAKYKYAIKKYNGSNTNWWLRSARSTINNFFSFVKNAGYYEYDYAYTSYGVAPAFRLG